MMHSDLFVHVRECFLSSKLCKAKADLQEVNFNQCVKNFMLPTFCSMLQYLPPANVSPVDNISNLLDIAG